MTSQPTITGVVARGAAPLLDYRCTSCGREFSGDAAFVRLRHTLPGGAAHCDGVVVLDVVRDDRAGVAVPTAIQPVGRDQLVAGGPGEPPLTRASRLPARRATPRRSERVRDRAVLALVAGLPCAAIGVAGHTCAGRIEVDHVGARPLGRKCSDELGQLVPLCSRAHRERTDFAGAFRDYSRADMRAFLAAAARATADQLTRRA